MQAQGNGPGQLCYIGFVSVQIRATVRQQHTSRKTAQTQPVSLFISGGIWSFKTESRRLYVYMLLRTPSTNYTSIISTSVSAL
jgi:hypothetical protein